MANYKNSNIPEDKFSQITIGNNGVRIEIPSIPVDPKNNVYKTQPPIYIKKDDIIAIYNKFFFPENNSDNNIVDRDDEISDAVY